MNRLIPITDQKISDNILLLRGKRVMLDRDLAQLYGIDTGNLNKAVKRNSERFPDDFMFQLSKEEMKSLIFQIGRANRGGTRHQPYVFTEQGVAMLSSVLKSKIAIQVNIQIIRVFTRMREFLSENKDVFLKMAIFEKKFLKHDKKLSKHEKEIKIIFAALKRLINPPVPTRKRIGFRITKDRD